MSKNYLRTSLDKYRKDQAICKCGHILGQHPMFDRNTVKIRCSAFGCECPNFDLLELPNGIVEILDRMF